MRVRRSAPYNNETQHSVRALRAPLCKRRLTGVDVPWQVAKDGEEDIDDKVT